MIPRRRLTVLLLALALLGGTAPVALAATQLNWTRGQLFALPLGLPGSTATLTSGPLPPGLSLTTVLTVPNINGTPTTAGTYPFTIQVTPLLGSPTSTSYSMVVANPPQIDQATLADGRVNVPYSETVTVSGGTSPVTFTPVTSGLPPGLQFDITNGTVTGTPTTAGSFTFTVQATDLAVVTTSRQVSIEVTEGPELEGTGTTAWTVGRPGFSFRVTGTGGTAPLDWDDPTGIPAGLDWNLAANVLTVSGTPTEVGQTRFSVTVRDALLSEKTLEQTLLVNSAPAITTTDLPGATVGAQYGPRIEVDGGAPAYAFRIVTSSAAWLGIGADTGTLSGAPDAVGDETVTVEVQDASGATAEKELTFTVNPAPTIPDVPLTIGAVGTEYVADLAATGGTAPHSFDIVAGGLPAGLRIEAGRITGTPTALGSYELTVEVSDAWGAAARRDLMILVGRPLPLNTKLPVTAILPGAREAFVFDVIAGTSMSAVVKAPGGADGLTVSLLRLDGSSIDVVPYMKLSRKSVKLKKVPIEETGRIALVLAASETAGVAVSGKVSGKALSSIRHQMTWSPAAGDQELPFAALEGARITIQAKSRGKDVPAAELVALDGPTGAAIDVGPFTKVLKGGFKIAKLTAERGGDHVLRYRPGAEGQATGVLKLVLRVKSPRQYVFSAPR